MKSLLLILTLLTATLVAAQERFDIRIERTSISGNLVEGKLYVNNKYLGKTYENNNLKVRPGRYPGFLRYISNAGHVTGPLGNIGKNGDFLLEIGSVTWSDGRNRSNLLFHGGDKPHQSKGCIMLGPVSRDSDGNRYLPPTHTLSKLRKEFYGTDNPVSSPNKKITIEIIGDHDLSGVWSGNKITVDIGQKPNSISINVREWKNSFNATRIGRNKYRGDWRKNTRNNFEWRWIMTASSPNKIDIKIERKGSRTDPGSRTLTK
ncbi:MAG: hypothetical protein RLN90_10360 [Balneolaceae bacterium]